MSYMGVSTESLSVGDWVVISKSGRTGEVIALNRRLVEVGFREKPDGPFMHFDEFLMRDVIRIGNPIGMVVWTSEGPFWRGRTVSGVAGEYVAFGPKADEPVRRVDAKILDQTLLLDVAEIVRSKMTTSFFELETRREFRNWYLNQMRVSNGIPSFLTTTVRPALHQLKIMTRVIEDPIRRYVLADEVGLGKTIETGLILRQILWEKPDAKIWVFAPTSLVEQWRNELRVKVRLMEEVGHSIIVKNYEELKMTPKSEIDMVVIDEAHRLCDADEPDFEYLRSVQRWTSVSAGLLLLSATPYRSESITFLRILNLIDPILYPMESLPDFEMRLDRRVDHADIVHSLSEEMSPDIALTLLANLPESAVDPDLRTVISRIEQKANDDNEDVSDEIQETRMILEERYRIGRRVIRTRRNSQLIDNFFVRGRSFDERKIVDKSRSVCDEFLEAWRISALDHNSTIGREVFPGLLEACLNGVSSLRRFVSDRVGALKSQNDSAFDGELEFLERFNSETNQSGHSRVEAFVLAIHSELSINRQQKIAIACSESADAEEILRKLISRFGGSAVEAHILGITSEDAREAIEIFETSPDCRVFVFDRSAEEGANLQVTTKLIHFDLPISVNRLEQRIGRADRYSDRSRRPVVNEVLKETDSQWVTGYQNFLSNALGIFELSVATVQRRLMTIMSSLITRLFEHGHIAFEESWGDIRLQLERERRRVERLEFVESQDFNFGFSRETYSDLLDFDEMWGDSMDVLDAITSRNNGLGITKFRRLGAKTPVFGYTIDRTFQNSPALYMGLSVNLPDFATPSRMAMKHGDSIRLLRLGDRFVDRLFQTLKTDSRGRFAMGHLYSPDVQFDQLWFEFEFWESLANSIHGSRTRESRLLQSAFPPLRIVIALDQDGRVVREVGREEKSSITRLNREGFEKVRGQFNVEECFERSLMDASLVADETFEKLRKEARDHFDKRSNRRLRMFNFQENSEAILQENLDRELILQSFDEPDRRLESVRMFLSSGRSYDAWKSST